MEVNFRCGNCSWIYDFEVGQPSMDDNLQLQFEHTPICTNCLAVHQELLTEEGQSQMTQWHLGEMDFD